MQFISYNTEALSYLANIPVAYQEVEYIENSSTWPYIDLGIYFTNLTKSHIKVMPKMTTGDVIYGMNEGSDTQDYRLFNYSNQFYFDLPGGSGSGNRIMGGSFAPNAVKEIEVGNFYVKNIGASSNIISGSTVGTFTASWTARLNGTSKSTNRRYRVKVRENGTLVRDLYACYRKSDNVVGMYDKVSGTFLTNAGSGSFTAWPAYKR